MSVGQKFYLWLHQRVRLIGHMNETLGRREKPGVVINRVTYCIHCSTRLSKYQLPTVLLEKFTERLHRVPEVPCFEHQRDYEGGRYLSFQRTQLID